MQLWFCLVSIPRGLEKAHDRNGLRRARPGKPDVLLLRLWSFLGGRDRIEQWINRNRLTVSCHSDFAPAAKQVLAITKRELGSFPTARCTSLHARGLFLKNPNSLCNFKALTPLKIQIFSAPARNWRFREVLSSFQNAKRPVNPLTSLFSLCLCRPMTQVWGAISALLFSNIFLTLPSRKIV